jgi:SHS2 domain-containing protein
MPGRVQEGYRFLDHVTDAFIEAWGPSLERALAQAGVGFFETMVDASKVQPDEEYRLEVEGHDELELVYNWLEELLLGFEIQRIVIAQFEVYPVQRSEKMLHLKATARGELYDPLRHGGKVEVKGITYHMMKVTREEGLVKIQYLLDL